MPPIKSRTRPCTRCALRRPGARGAPRGPPPPPAPLSPPCRGEAAEGGGGGGAGGGGAGGGSAVGGVAMEVPDWDAAETFQALRGGRGYEGAADGLAELEAQRALRPRRVAPEERRRAAAQDLAPPPHLGKAAKQ